MTLGPTHYRWHTDVRAVVQSVEARWPRSSANTYIDHPWPGWDRFSIDFWGAGGRGDAIGVEMGQSIRRFLLERNGPPFIRHLIFRRTLWTSWGGVSPWGSLDHSGNLRHVHVTYWK